MRKIELMHSMFGRSGSKCKDCSHFSEHQLSRKYFKCDVYGESASEATDWRANYQSCGLFNKFTAYENVYKMAKTERSEIVDGQLSIFDMEE